MFRRSFLRRAFRPQDNLSPLHVAAGMGHIEVTKRLLDNGADMEAEDNALYTPLWRAAYYGHPEVVEARLVLCWEGARRTPCLLFC